MSDRVGATVLLLSPKYETNIHKTSHVFVSDLGPFPQRFNAAQFSSEPSGDSMRVKKAEWKSFIYANFVFLNSRDIQCHICHWSEKFFFFSIKQYTKKNNYNLRLIYVKLNFFFPPAE